MLIDTSCGFSNRKFALRTPAAPKWNARRYCTPMDAYSVRVPAVRSACSYADRQPVYQKVIDRRASSLTFQDYLK
ncbi:MAG: hypothetical protein MR873_00190 [Parabacteroides sp.]|nr:hypothetical protein [Parabacteroides sp.]